MTTTADRRAAAARDTAIARALRGAARRSKAPSAAETAEHLRYAGLDGENLEAALEAAERVREAAAADQSLFGVGAERLANAEAAAIVDALPGPDGLAAERARRRDADVDDFGEEEAQRVVEAALRPGGAPGSSSLARAAHKGIRT